MMKVAVVGVGAMGKNHARVYQELPGVELVAVADQSESAVSEIGRMLHVPAYIDYLEMVQREKPDAVSVVVPTQVHFPVARVLLQLGCHILVEKPIAATLDEANELIQLAEKNHRVLMVGHIERYNPAIIDLKRRLTLGELGRVFQIYARRLGPFPPRIKDVGVVMDLATHDLDIMRYLTGSEVIRVYAETRQEVHASKEDLFAGILRFQDGTVGLLEINWLTPTKIRELYVTGERGMFRVDYLTQDLYFYENAELENSDWPAISLLRGVQEGKMIHFPIQKREPLRNELESFISCIQGMDSMIVNGYDAQMALALAQELVASAWSYQVKEVGNGYTNGQPRADKVSVFRAS